LRGRACGCGRSALPTPQPAHESYLRYLQGGKLRAEDRRAFFAYASQVMRSVVVSCARERAAQKRGSGWRPLTLTTRVADRAPEGEDEILRVHEALDSLEQLDARLAQVVQMRYFGGYSEQEIAETLEVTERTVQRLWLKGKADAASDGVGPAPHEPDHREMARLGELLDEALPCRRRSGAPGSTRCRAGTCRWCGRCVVRYSPRKRERAGRWTVRRASRQAAPRRKERPAAMRANGSALTSCCGRWGPAAWRTSGSPAAPTARSSARWR
jgi:RNA polymerase sigma factor (TIGR02999 family)